MTYEDALAFWYGRIDYERRQPRPGDLKLDRMRSLLRGLGDPHLRCRTVHVAGTKGKGSTSAILASILQSAGYRTGLFTSPHLSDISERVRVDGVPISRDEIAARMGEVARVVAEMDRAGDPSRCPTFFEVITALGFLHFDCRRVDLSVIEVGLGGRFDSTNVCEPLVSIITNISYDHMALLGDTLEEIAFQKAGIIKRGVPVVTTAEDPGALSTIERVAREQHAPLQAFGRDFVAETIATPPFEPAIIRLRTGTRDHGETAFGMFGSHQAVNAAGAVAAIEVLRARGMRIADGAVVHGLREVSWPARLELISRAPVVVLDCAHNVASAVALVETLQQSFPVKGKRTLVFAASADKQITEMLAILVPYFDRVLVTKYFSNPRSADPNAVANTVKQLGGVNVEVMPTPDEAWHCARATSGADDAIVITGSVFLAGELRPILLRDC